MDPSIAHISIDGGRLAVQLDGPTDGPLVICSHALGDTRESFALLTTALVARGYRVARPDLRGHGDSSGNFNTYGDDATADDILEIIRIFGGGKPAVLAGASLSAGAATIVAGRHPELVEGLILLGPFLRNGISNSVKSRRRVAFWRPWGPWVWRGQLAKLWPGLPAGEARDRAERLMELLQRPGRWAEFQKSFAQTDHAVVEPWIKKVRAPVLVIMGDADPDWSDPVGEAEWVVSQFEDVETVIVHGAGHAPMMEKPEVVDPAVLRFLERVYRR